MPPARGIDTERFEHTQQVFFRNSGAVVVDDDKGNLLARSHADDRRLQLFDVTCAASPARRRLQQ